MTRHSSSRLHAAALISLLLVAIVLASPVAAQRENPPEAGPQPGAIGEPAAPLSEKRVYDMANLLNNDQEASIEQDASRLTRHGLPAMVIVQLAAMTPAEADAFAADVRRQWSVETSPGADDGLVMLVTVVDTGNRHGIFTTLSWGTNALPHFGVTATTASEIQRAWLDRYIDAGHLYEGIDYALRRLIYHSIYEPAPQAPLTGPRAALGTAMSLAGPLLAIAAAALAVRRWARASARERSADLPGLALRRAMPALAVAVFGLAVVGHSGWGVVGALGLLGVATAAWVARDPRRVMLTRETT